MKICTITCSNAVNYGARLQAYALATYLIKQGHEVEVIDYRPTYMDFYTKKWYWPRKSIKEWVKLLWQFRQRATAIRRHAAIEHFSKEYLPLTTQVYHNINELRKNSPQADAYIAGSDQIWNTYFHNGTDEAFYLNFGTESIRRISYAASFATVSLAPKTEEFVRKNLGHFNNLSVREESGLHILHTLGYQGEVVADPAFLLQKEDWDKVATSAKHNDNYILVYDFMRSKSLRRLAKRLSALLHCNIFSIGAHRLNYADKCFCEASPRTFIRLIKDARCVLSNSFHGTVFAMIYHRDFFVMRREDGLNNRMEDWLLRCGLQDRIIGEEANDTILCRHIDYGVVDKYVSALIKRSEEYLRMSLHY